MKNRYSLLKELSILVVEDNESELEELGELFDIFFKVCFRARNGQEGVQKFKKNRPDIVLSDVGMPVMDGFDMAVEIRKIDKNAPILLHTIYANNDIFLKAIEYKISGYMLKPTNATLLLDTILKECESVQKDKELKNEKMLMQAILEEFPDRIMVTDLDQNILFANNAIKKGKYWNKASPKKCYQVLYGNNVPCDKLGYKCDSHNAIKTGKSFKSIHTDKSIGSLGKCLSIKTVPIKDIDGNPYALLKVVQDRTDEANREKKLTHLANYDLLTNLPNRTLLHDRLKQAMFRSDRTGLIFALLFVDLDDFKIINDTYGHRMGDKLLEKVAWRMKSSIRKIDTLARYGGDEFIIILEEITSMQNILFIAEDILSKLKNEFNLSSSISVNISCSIGIDIYNPNSDKTDNMLIQNADKAMYEAKKAGKNSYLFFEK